METIDRTAVEPIAGCELGQSDLTHPKISFRAAGQRLKLWGGSGISSVWLHHTENNRRFLFCCLFQIFFHCRKFKTWHLVLLRTRTLKMGHFILPGLIRYWTEWLPSENFFNCSIILSNLFHMCLCLTLWMQLHKRWWSLRSPLHL